MKQTNARKLILSMDMSFDGIVVTEHDQSAGETDAADHNIENSDELWNHMFNDLASVDTILTGGGMNPEYFDHWRAQLSNPTADPNEVKYARWAYQIPHIVFSKTQQKVDWPNSRIATNPEAEIVSLKQQPGKDILTWGGATFANYLISKGLIDEYNIRVSPKIFGRGKTLFNNIQYRSNLSLIDVRQLKSGIVMLRYKA
ncbi:MAG: dihydrofolate reductase family protein [Chitinophagaceae bacterium]|nr:dihydrofolate reductase family protein [Chitinophagaceae bacterium]